MAEHTQLPWERLGLMLIAPDGSKVVHFGGFRKEGREAEANAALAHVASNNHKALVEALETIAGGLTNKFPGAPDVMNTTPDEFRHAMWSWSQAVARAVLKLEEA